jgi:TRAP-type C4-dicarboxylate transport system substrate-binding protein
MPVGSVFQLYTEFETPRRVKEAVKFATGADMEITHNSSLVKAVDVIDAVRDGRVEMGFQGAMYRGDMTLLNCLAFPAVVPFEECPKIERRLYPIFENVLRTQFDVEPLGMGYWPRQLLISKRPAATFNDLKGIKFRCHSYELLQLMKAAGGSPVTMDYMEVYLALQKGALDGAVSSLSGIAGQKWHEAVKHVNWWPMGTVTYFAVVNKDAWKKLPVNVQRAVRETVSKAMSETWEMSDLEDQKTKDVFTKQYGCTHHFPPKEEVAKLSQMVGPVIQDWKKRAGPRAGEVISVFNQVLGTKF